MFAALEAPAAYSAFAYALVTLLWKSVGVDWIPILGPAWNRIFDDTLAEGAQYPRRSQDEEFWHWVYLLMYGAWGTAAQWCGLRITTNRRRRRSSSFSNDRDASVRLVRTYGSFHVVIGVHHLLWSVGEKTTTYGKLELWRFRLPGVYAGTALSALLLLYHASYLVLYARTIKLKDVCRRKAVMDTATCCTFVSFVVFLLANMAGADTSYETNRWLWAVTMYSVPVVLLFGSVVRPE